MDLETDKKGAFTYILLSHLVIVYFIKSAIDISFLFTDS